MTYQIKLPVFEGPFDLLLHLIKKDKVDIYDIPIAKITEEYLEYIKMMEMLDLEIAGEFVVMAATLIHIKSKMLLPEEKTSEEEGDPRSDLVKRLLEYQKFKEASLDLSGRELKQQNIFWHTMPAGEGEQAEEFIEATLFDLLSAFQGILISLPKTTVYEIAREEISIVQKINEILDKLEADEQIIFNELFAGVPNRQVIIATFLALLELIKLKLVQARQMNIFEEIRIYRTPGSTVPSKLTAEQIAQFEESNVDDIPQVSSAAGEIAADSKG